MKAIIITALLGWIVSAWIRSAQARKRAEAEARREADISRLYQEQMEQRAKAREETARLIELQREQFRQAREQERLAKEQEKQAAVLAKHEEEINKLKFRMSQAESDIDHWKEQIGNLYALLDVAENELEQSIIGGKNQAKYQKQIITLNNQIHAAEARLAKAEYTKAEASRKLAA